MSGIDAGARRAARLAAVQALYQMELAGVGASEVVEEFTDHRFTDTGPTDAAFFAALVEGVPPHQNDIDRAIAGCLSEKWKLERVDSILRAILRAATFELVGRRDIPAKVVIDEYVGIAHDFFEGDEPGFVNAALDRLAHQKRAAEFGEPVPDGELDF